MGTEALLSLLTSELPLRFEQYTAGGKRVGLVIVDEVNGFATVGAGNCVSIQAQADSKVALSDVLVKIAMLRGTSLALWTLKVIDSCLFRTPRSGPKWSR